MKKEDVIVIAQLLSAMKDSVRELEEAQRRNDGEKILIVKKEILNFQKKIDEAI